MELTLELVKNYIYVYTDLEKPGHYITYTSKGKLVFNHEPVYIGKGSNNRMIKHQNSAENQRLSELIERGNFECYKLYENLASHDAYLLETELIYKIGRIDLGKGPLFNESAGFKFIESDETLDVGPYHLEFNRLIHILKTLNSTRTIKEAAEALKISERTLYRYTSGYRLEKIDGDWIQV